MTPNEEIIEKVLKEEDWYNDLPNNKNIQMSKEVLVKGVSKAIKKTLSLQRQELASLQEKHRLDLADAQFTGFHLGKWGADMNELISSMGLIKKEWNILKKDYELTLHEEEVEEISKIFKEMGQ